MIQTESNFRRCSAFSYEMLVLFCLLEMLIDLNQKEVDIQNYY